MDSLKNKVWTEIVAELIFYVPPLLVAEWWHGMAQLFHFALPMPLGHSPPLTFGQSRNRSFIFRVGRRAQMLIFASTTLDIITMYQYYAWLTVPSRLHNCTKLAFLPNFWNFITFLL
jgi:hypothetical protein